MPARIDMPELTYSERNHRNLHDKHECNDPLRFGQTGLRALQSQCLAVCAEHCMLTVEQPDSESLGSCSGQERRRGEASYGSEKPILGGT